MIVVDVETTGLNPVKCSILSIGALDFNNPTNQFYLENRIFEGAEISPKALEINGFSYEQITSQEKPTLKDAIGSFLDWTKNIPDRTIAGENPFFDNSFIIAAAERCNLKHGLGSRIIDLHSISYVHHLRTERQIPLNKNRTALNLDSTLNYVGLPSEQKPHNALRGAKLEAEAFSRLIYGKNILKEFKEFAIPGYLP